MAGFPKLFVVLGAVLGGLSVALGAFGAHGLKASVTPERLAVFETAVRYQFFHALALILLGLIASQRPSGMLEVSGWCFVAGTALFSGSLYLLVLSDTGWLGAITPIGGVAMILGWALFALGVVRAN